MLSIGFAILLRAVAAIAKKDPHGLAPVLRHHGDLGAGAEEILQGQQTPSPLTLTRHRRSLRLPRPPARPSAAKQALFEQTLRHLSALEAKYFIKLCTSELRIGLKKAWLKNPSPSATTSLTSIQRANMRTMTGDIERNTPPRRRWSPSRDQLELFRPISVMLASPVDTAADLIAVFPTSALVEEKFDGIRAQVHKRGTQVEIFSRTLDRVTEFPELLPAIRKIPADFILDGEIIGWRNGQAIPFTGSNSAPRPQANRSLPPPRWCPQALLLSTSSS